MRVWITRRVSERPLRVADAGVDCRIATAWLPCLGIEGSAFEDTGLGMLQANTS